jgi:hypothetical protein
MPSQGRELAALHQRWTRRQFRSTPLSTNGADDRKKQGMTFFALRVPDHLMERPRWPPPRSKCGLKLMRDRAARAKLDAALAILDKAPDVAPDPGDEIPK